MVWHETFFFPPGHATLQKTQRMPSFVRCISPRSLNIRTWKPQKQTHQLASDESKVLLLTDILLTVSLKSYLRKTVVKSRKIKPIQLTLNELPRINFLYIIQNQPMQGCAEELLFMPIVTNKEQRLLCMYCLPK